MFESIINFFKKMGKTEKEQSQGQVQGKSKDAAKERLHLVLMQDRANVSADFLDLMKQEIIEVIKKYIDVDENAIDVRLTNKANGDGTTGAPALYANIPIVSIKEEARGMVKEHKEEKNTEKQDTKEAEEKAEESNLLQENNKAEESKKEEDKIEEKVQEEAVVELEVQNKTEEKESEQKQEEKKVTQN